MKLQELLRADGELNDCWVVSDTHWFHANIVRYAGRPADHEQRMLDAWRELVRPTDVVLHLGDIAMGRREQLTELTQTLPGRILMVRGNHDRQSRAFYARLGITVIDPFCGRRGRWLVRFTHRPDPDFVAAGPRRISAHGHIHQQLMNDQRCLNLCVEHTGYAPVRLHGALDQRIAELESTAARRRRAAA